MTLAELGPLAAYRMHTSRWATALIRGARVAAYGGRANRPGTQALYLSLEPEAAVRAYQQLLPLMSPGALVSSAFRIVPVLDFRAGYEGARWPNLYDEFHCDWCDLWFNQRVEPPSCVLAAEAIAAGAKGIVFASKLAPSELSLVISNDLLTCDDTLQMSDPTGALSKNQDSWR